MSGRKRLIAVAATAAALVLAGVLTSFLLESPAKGDVFTGQKCLRFVSLPDGAAYAAFGSNTAAGSAGAAASSAKSFFAKLYDKSGKLLRYAPWPNENANFIFQTAEPAQDGVVATVKRFDASKKASFLRIQYDRNLSVISRREYDAANVEYLACFGDFTVALKDAKSGKTLVFSRPDGTEVKTVPVSDKIFIRSASESGGTVLLSGLKSKYGSDQLANGYLAAYRTAGGFLWETTYADANSAILDAAALPDGNVAAYVESDTARGVIESHGSPLRAYTLDEVSPYSFDSGGNVVANNTPANTIRNTLLLLDHNGKIVKKVTVTVSGEQAVGGFTELSDGSILAAGLSAHSGAYESGRATLYDQNLRVKETRFFPVGDGDSSFLASAPNGGIVFYVANGKSGRMSVYRTFHGFAASRVFLSVLHHPGFYLFYNGFTLILLMLFCFAVLWVLLDRHNRRVRRERTEDAYEIMRKYGHKPSGM